MSNIILNSDSKNIIITGINGQDGSLMADFLLKNTNHIIYGTMRKNSNNKNIKHIQSDHFNIINLDLRDSSSIKTIIDNIKPDYFINFAGQSNVSQSWDMSKYTFEINTIPIICILESILQSCPNCKFYNAGSSEEFGNIIYYPQDEHHPLKPLSPYAASKVSARQIINVYRMTYNLYAIQGWLFNHEGTRRNLNFVTRKISNKVANIYYAIKNNESFSPLELGNIYSSRDWSDAEDFIDGIWRMLNQDIFDKYYNNTPKEYILSSGKNHSIKQFVEIAFKYINIEGYWKNISNRKIDEKFFYKNEQSQEILLVTINPKFYRKCEVNKTCGNTNKIKYELGWESKIEFEQLIKKMVLYDIQLIKENNYSV